MLNVFNYVVYYSMAIVFVAITSYLIGCFNASIIVTSLFGDGKDVRKVGSGNAGFTNVLRTKGKKLALMTFVIDFLKGVIAVYLSKSLFLLFFGDVCNYSDLILVEYVSCAFCIVGHIYPCFFEFRGGKAILTTWSAMLLIDLKIFVVLISVFLVVLILTKIVSLSSVIAAISYPISTAIITCFFERSFERSIFEIIIPVSFSFFISCLVIYKHKENIRRILNGNEQKINIHK